MITPRPKDYYVYIHYKGLNPVYVGMGKNGRFVEHRTSGRVREYEWDGFRVVADGLPRQEALELERFIISEYGLDNLENKDPALRGYATRGRKWSEEQKRKHSLKIKQTWNKRKQEKKD